MADPKSAGQLISGFHAIEDGAWRWTERKFVISLRPPASAAEKGAILDLKLTVPPPTAEKVGAVTLTASIGGTALTPETYSKSGEYNYRRDVPPALLAGDSVRVEFELDKAIPPGDPDIRELGVIVLRAGLESR
jgi:hypothetical protein